MAEASRIERPALSVALLQINLFGKVIGRFRWGGLSRKTARKMMNMAPLFEAKADADLLHDMISFASNQKLLYRRDANPDFFEGKPNRTRSALPRLDNPSAVSSKVRAPPSRGHFL